MLTNITTYDSTIKQFHAQYKLPYTWELIKAQLYQESNLNPKAVSPVGAEGLAQFMPDTWADQCRNCGIDRNTPRFDTRVSIQLCCSYMKTLIAQWSAPRPDIDRYCLALASYNAGLGHIIEAQRLASKQDGRAVNDYATIIAQLQNVTGLLNAKQTKDYITKILGYYLQQTKCAEAEAMLKALA